MEYVKNHRLTFELSIPPEIGESDISWPLAVLNMYTFIVMESTSPSYWKFTCEVAPYNSTVFLSCLHSSEKRRKKETQRTRAHTHTKRA